METTTKEVFDIESIVFQIRKIRSVANAVHNAMMYAPDNCKNYEDSIWLIDCELCDVIKRLDEVLEG